LPGTCVVSIHAPARGATPTTSMSITAPSFQSTLPRGERLYGKFGQLIEVWVSIHAPARGATPRRL